MAACMIWPCGLDYQQFGLCYIAHVGHNSVYSNVALGKVASHPVPHLYSRTIDQSYPAISIQDHFHLIIQIYIYKY